MPSRNCPFTWVALLHMGAICVGIASNAYGGVISITGEGDLITPPPLVTSRNSYASVAGYAAIWNERQNVAVTNMDCDSINNPMDPDLNGSGPMPIPGMVSGAVDSHFIYYSHDNGLSPPQTASGTVTFSGPIVGLILENSYMLASEPIVGAPGTTFDPTTPFFQILPPGSIPPFPGIAYLKVTGATLTFDLFGGLGTGGRDDTVGIRVLTAVPSPSAALAVAIFAGVFNVRRRTR